MIRIRTSSWLCASLLCAASAAQTDPLGYFRSRPWINGTMQAADVGDYYGNWRKSLMLVSSSQLYFLYGFGRYEAECLVAEAPTGITGLVTVPQFPGPKDGILVACTDSVAPLRLGLYDDTGPVGTFVFTDAGTAGSFVSWSGATKLVARADADGSTCYFAARSADGQSLLMARRTSTNTLEPLGIAPAGGQIQDLCITNWDGDAELEFVASTMAGFIIVNTVGGQSSAQPAAMGYHAMADVRRQSTEQTAIFTFSQSPGVLSAIIGKNGTVVQSMAMQANGMTVPAQVPVSLAVHDVNGDGTSEVLLHQYGSQYLRIVRPGDNAQIAVPIAPTPIANPQLNLCRVLWTDLDYDGLLDAVYFDNSGNRIITRMHCVGWAAYPHAGPGTFAPMQMTPAFGLSSGEVANATYVDATLRFTLAPPNASTIPSAAKIIVTVWHQEAESPYISSQAVTTIRTVNGDWNVEAPVGIPNELWNGDHVYVDVRCVKPNGQTCYANMLGLAWEGRGDAPIPISADDPRIVNLLAYMESLEKSTDAPQPRILVTMPAITNGAYHIGGIITRLIPPRPPQGPPDESGG